MVDYRLPISGMYSATTNPNELRNRYLVVKALINIRPPHEILTKKIAEEDSIIKNRCYVAIMIGTEGEDVCRYVIEKAIEKESDERKLSRLNIALTMLNKDFPEKEEKEN